MIGETSDKTNPSEASIAVIIVNYGTADLAINAVESVLRHQHGGRSVEVHVVDNDSPGNDAEALAEAHAAQDWGKQVTLWPEPENHGFGRGNNRVLEELAGRDAPPKLVFLLNPDARLGNEAIDILAAALEAEPNAGAAGAGMACPDGSPVSGAFRFPGLVSDLMQTVNFGPLDQLLVRYAVPLSPDHPEGPVDWVSGAAVMFRFDALMKVGFFDPAFFLYFEETELQSRLGRAGWSVLYVPRARVVHDAGAATDQFRDRRQPQPAYLYQSKWLCARKTRGRLRALVAALLMIPAAILNIVQWRLRGRAPTLPPNFFRDHWRYGILPLLLDPSPA